MFGVMQSQKTFSPTDPCNHYLITELPLKEHYGEHLLK